MSITLTEARRLLSESVLHAGAPGSSYETSKLDDAIKQAGDEFLRITKAATATHNVTLTAGTHKLDLQAALTSQGGFIIDDFVSAHIDPLELRLAPIDAVMRRHSPSTPAGVPTLIAFRSDTDAWFDKAPATDQTIAVTVIRGLTDFTSGTATPESVTLNLPDAWATGIIGWGASHYLIRNAPGHPDSGPARVEFNNLLVDAAERFPDTLSGVRDRNAHPIQRRRTNRDG